MLEEQNQFIENEFQQQLERVSNDKNEQISRLTQIVDRQAALEKMQQSELEIRELRSKLSSKEDENQALIHLVIVLPPSHR